MQIGQREISDDAPVYIIAEVGVNHDGDPQKAVDLVDMAASAGADAVKVQVFRAEMLMSKTATLAEYQRDAGEADPAEMLRRLELDEDSLASVIERARGHGMQAIGTVFSPGIVRTAEALGFDAYKTASPDIVNKPLLESLSATGKPLIVSTGASELWEVRRAFKWLDGARERLALLQCVSCYPTLPEEASIAAMLTLHAMSGLTVGYSDHTTEEDTGALAVSIGARILEKHLTYDPLAFGPDHGASLGPEAFARYCRAAREERPGSAAEIGEAMDSAWLASDPRFGDGQKRVLDCEKDVRRVSRQSLALLRPKKAGETINRNDLTTMRPGTGLSPALIDEASGRKASCDLQAGVILTSGDVQPPLEDIAKIGPRAGAIGL
ncbi:MAG: hypothetical protein EA423_11400 [Phycisphaerales bacterium]|nr:MAG: hypothetical protein EA423_11400 [Phycisphaerales bacterium]